jgi:hypothetical protein
VNRVGRLVVVALAVLVAVLPLAREWCRATCVSSSDQADARAVTAHACHEASGGSGPTASPNPRTCGHSDEAGASELIGVRTSKSSAAVPVLAVVNQSVIVSVASIFPGPPGTAVPLQPPALSRNLPLRL